MSEYLSDLAHFLRVVVRNWFGTVGMAMTAAEVLRQTLRRPLRGTLRRSRLVRMVRRFPFGWFAVLCLFLASFQAWQEQKNAREQAEASRVNIGANVLPRALDESQKAAVASILPADEECGLSFRVPSGDGGLRDLALSIIEAIGRKKWRGSITPAVRGEWIEPGIVIFAHSPDDPLATQIAATLRGFNVPAQVQPWEGPPSKCRYFVHLGR
jgi:hypothetical protein